MTTICAEQHKLHPTQHLLHHHQHHHRLKKPTIEIPPRKLLFVSNKTHDQLPSPDSPNMLNRHLPRNIPTDNNSDSDSDSDSDDPYATDHFRMYEFKVRRCTRSRSHDWTDCPFAHPGEKARRRDPRRFHYSGAVCSEFRRGGGCSRGDECEFAHGVFECWLHPSRYRTEACKDGKNCKRKVCFFAHSPRQLRILPEILGSNCTSSSLSPIMNHIKANSNSYSKGSGPCCCCLFCRTVSESPTSTLLGLSHLSRSPSLSPPVSPVNEHRASTASVFSPISRYTDQMGKKIGMGSYKDMLSELKNSLEAMTINEVVRSCSPPTTPSPLSLQPGGNCGSSSSNSSINIPWLEICFNGDPDFEQQKQQFVNLSPSTPIGSSGSGSAELFNENCSRQDYHEKILGMNNDHSGNGSACADVDLGWVNELLM